MKRKKKKAKKRYPSNLAGLVEALNDAGYETTSRHGDLEVKESNGKKVLVVRDGR